MKKLFSLTLGITAVFLLNNVSAADKTGTDDGALSLEAVTAEAGEAELQQPGFVPPPYPYAYQPPCGFRTPFGYPPYSEYGTNPSPFRCRAKQRFYAPAFRPAFYPADLPPHDLNRLQVPAPAPEAARAVSVGNVPAPYAAPQPQYAHGNPAYPSQAPYAAPQQQYPYGNPAYPGQATVIYRPTPIKNFLSLLHAPRPYIGYDPYVQPAPPYAQPYAQPAQQYQPYGY
ncbi:MAG: hypothetical protein LBT89_06975 [Planctomycetaceae bacterium]|jgi:hypothetical protein|nr:hypothetical protein [Planctomycetaceae bacterium]